ncbi:MAG: molybdate transport system ATP-binding protein [Pseudonocardiales bacterium]|jgi:molybdate transport system ATP-binding protein|nr:molybdate transport system ATP-binding protein [Pseudonocardiales bacterium]
MSGADRAGTHRPPTSAALAVNGSVELGTFRLDIDLAVGAGEVLGVLGPNGAGKTTLLRALAGLTMLTTGQIALDGERLDDCAGDIFVPSDQRPIGVVFQNYRLFPHLTVRDNIAFAPRCRRTGRRESRAIAQRWMDRLGLSELSGRKPAELSGGQAQRVALARALAADPGLLLLDEPLAALDARTKLEVRAELRRHLADFPGPTLLVTHDPLEAMVMTDRLVVIESGQIVQQGPPAEVARRPATQYVARVVGLNLYRGTRDATGKVALDAGGTLIASGLLDLNDQATNGAAPTGRVLVAIRPTAIAMHTTRPEHSSPRNVWQGTVTGLELLTDRVRAEINGAPPALVDITPDAVADLDLANGRPIWLSAKATDIDVYRDPA